MSARGGRGAHGVALAGQGEGLPELTMRRLIMRESQMSKRANRWAVAAVTVMALWAGLSGMARADQQNEQAVLEAFQKGISFYETGEYAKAKAEFDRLLSMEPGAKTALKMRDMAELGQFIEMRAHEELAPEASKIADLMLRAAREQYRSVSGIEALLEQFQSDDLATYGKARAALISHGPYAVPYLLELLAIDDASKQEIVGRTISALTAAHKDTCLPLIRALQGCENSLLRERVAAVLGQIGDRRALPALKAACEQEPADSAVKEAAAKAIQAITGKRAEEIEPCAELYLSLGAAYLKEDKVLVGYTYGLSADVWQWDPSGADLAHRVAYETVPSYLYYQRMATQTALDGLALDPGNQGLRALLAASLARQWALCEYFKSAPIRFGGAEVAADVKQRAAELAEALSVQAPVTIQLMPAPVLARALTATLAVGDPSASLVLVRALADKLQAAGPEAPDKQTADALMGALDSGDRNVRYEAAIALVRSCPTGTCGDAEKIVQALKGALGAAVQRNVLVLMNDFDMRNNLVTIIRSSGVATTETEVASDRIGFALSLQPAVDMVVLSGNVSQGTFNEVFRLLAQDPRTKSAPLYVVVDPKKPAADLSTYDEVARVLSPDDLRPAVIQPILDSEVLAQSRSAFTEQEEAIVLKALDALSAVSPLNTEYPLKALEPAIIKALTGYSEPVTTAALGALAAFGTDAAIVPVSNVIGGSGSAAVRVAACHSAAALLKRSEKPAPQDVVDVLKQALASDEQELRRAAADALSAAGLPAEQLLSLVCTEGLASK